MKEIYKIINNFKIDKKYWNTTMLSGEDYFIRSKPAPYVKKTIEIAKLLGLKTVVEIGSTRYAVSQKCLDFYENGDGFNSPPCCTDGHCGFFFGENNFEVYSVDIDENCITQINWSYDNLNRVKPENIHVEIPKDGINFLQNFEKKIDVLFLDGWDVGTPNYAEKHLEAFLVSQDKLSDVHLILIDDTDFSIEGGGKDGLLTPYLLDIGYIPLLTGRQTLFINTNNVTIDESLLYKEPHTQLKTYESYEYDNSKYNEEFSNPDKIILSMTTIPIRLKEERHGWGIKPVLDILLNLSYTNYEIHLNIPYISQFNNTEYEIPKWLLDLQESNNKLKIFRCNDYGSVTKIVPTLLRISDPDQTIITVDDDLLYMDGFIQYLLKKEKEHPNSSLGFAGIGSYDGSCHFCTTLPKDTKVKILEGYKTVLYKRKFFTEDFFIDFVGKSWNDDLIISSHLAKNNIDRYVVNYNKDQDFNPRVESFPCIKTVMNEKSGCNLYREKSIYDNHTEFYKKYID